MSGHPRTGKIALVQQCHTYSKTFALFSYRASWNGKRFCVVLVLQQNYLSGHLRTGKITLVSPLPLFHNNCTSCLDIQERERLHLCHTCITTIASFISGHPGTGKITLLSYLYHNNYCIHIWTSWNRNDSTCVILVILERERLHLCHACIATIAFNIWASWDGKDYTYHDNCISYLGILKRERLHLCCLVSQQLYFISGHP